MPLVETNPTIVWFRRDLRLADNPALDAALRNGSVLPVYIWSPDEESPWQPGAASRWWLHHSLERLDQSLRRHDGRLILRRGGSTAEALTALVREINARAIYWNRLYEPSGIERDAAVERALAAANVECRSFPSALLFEPGQVRTKQGGPYQVFTPFWNAISSLDDPSDPLPAPRFRMSPAPVESLDLQALQLLPRIDWAGGLRATWNPGEGGAAEQLSRFLDGAITQYPEERNRPDHVGTSRLSPHLHFGEISPRTIWHAAKSMMRVTDSRPAKQAAWEYLRQIAWRDFSHHLLVHFPHTPDKPLRPEFAHFRWEANAHFLAAWQRGRTGYPIVDAGMRELWATGWMHNRVRMIVASFLVKDLLIDWRDGARWFWDTLVDASLANNTMGWQWTAGCGADAAPFFRIFNPVTQSQKFDPDGAYIRTWVPQIARLPGRHLHAPWLAPTGILRDAGINLGETYPAPIVDHAAAREVALASYARIRQG